MSNFHGPYADIAEQVRTKRECEQAEERRRLKESKQKWRQIAKEAKDLAARAYALPGPRKPWWLLFDAGELAEELGKE